MLNDHWIANVFRSVACVVAALTTTTAFAEDSGFYLGIDLGQARYSAPELKFIAPNSDIAERFDADGFARGIHGGYRFNRFLSVEAAYADLGRSSVTITQTDRAFSAVARESGDIASRGFTFSGLATLPAGKWEYSAQVGVFLSHSEFDGVLESTSPTLTIIVPNSNTAPIVTATSPIVTTIIPIGASTGAEDLLAGLRVSYVLDNRYVISLDWTRFFNVGRDTIGEIGIKRIDRVDARMSRRF